MCYTINTFCPIIPTNRLYMKHRHLSIAMILTISLLTSCSSNKNEESPKTPAKPENIIRLDQILENYNSLDSTNRIKTLTDNKIIIDKYLQIIGQDTTSDQTLTLLSDSRMVKMFGNAVNKEYKDLAPEQQQLGNIITRGHNQGLNLDQTAYVATIWGQPKSIIFNNGVMYIALNHYLGPNHEAYNGIPEYERRTKTRANIPYDMAEALIATTYPISESNTTVLSHLLYQGAIAQAKMLLLDNPSEAMALGFSEAQFNDIAKNERFMWERLLYDDMIHSSDPIIVSSLFSPSPVTGIISPDAPGRAARYIGYRIVKSYLRQHPDTQLSQLLSPKFYNNPSTLAQASYQPQ